MSIGEERKMALNEADRNSYEKNGFLVVRDILSRGQLEGLRKECDSLLEDAISAHSAKRTASVGFRLESPELAAQKTSVRSMIGLAAKIDFFKSVASTPKILEIAAELTGGAEQLMLHGDQIFLKPPYLGTARPLHQDNGYFHVEPHSAAITCWMALDDATLENGCLSYVPGSHMLGLLPHCRFDDHNLTVSETGSMNEVPVPVPAGSCVFHHVLTLHRSSANKSAFPRRAYAAFYVNRAARRCKLEWSKMLPL